jgi:hypothetical protein
VPSVAPPDDLVGAVLMASSTRVWLLGNGISAAFVEFCQLRIACVTQAEIDYEISDYLIAAPSALLAHRA